MNNLNNGDKITIKVKRQPNSSRDGVRKDEPCEKCPNLSDDSRSSIKLVVGLFKPLPDFPNKKQDQSKTKKKKSMMSEAQKASLWSIFENSSRDIARKSEVDGTYGEGRRQNPYDKKIDVESVISLEKHSIDVLNEPLKEMETCHLCNSHLIIMDNGFPTCTNPKCGIMYKDILDYSPEWRFYGADDKNAVDPTRCGNPINPLLIESSFGCKVLCTGKSSYEMKKIRKWTEWQSMPHREKSLYDEFQFITVMAQNAGIPRIFIDYAMTIHKDISEQKMFRGMNRDGIKAASIYISCRLNGCPRTAHEIAEIFRLDKTSATNGCSMAVNILQNIERNIEPANKTDLCATLPSSFIDRYCSRLNFNKEMTMLSKFVANKIEKENIITDNIPHAISAGIVYFVGQVCQSNNTKQEVKVISGVSEVTINKCYKKLDALRESLIPSSILAKYL